MARDHNAVPPAIRPFSRHLEWIEAGRPRNGGSPITDEHLRRLVAYGERLQGKEPPVLADRDYDLTIAEIRAMPHGTERAIHCAVSGLLEDGDHHKRWWLEQVLESLGVDLKELRLELLRIGDGHEWEEGIPP